MRMLISVDYHPPQEKISTTCSVSSTMHQQKHQYLVFHHMVNEEQNKETNWFHVFGVIIGVDLLDRLLSFDPRLRPTAEEAIGRLL